MADPQFDDMLKAWAEPQRTDLPPEPDCRTCEHFYVIPRGKLCRECANGDNHQPLPPVRLYRKGLD